MVCNRIKLKSTKPSIQLQRVFAAFMHHTFRWIISISDSEASFFYNPSIGRSRSRSRSQSRETLPRGDLACASGADVRNSFRSSTFDSYGRNWESTCAKLSSLFKISFFGWFFNIMFWGFEWPSYFWSRPSFWMAAPASRSAACTPPQTPGASQPAQCLCRWRWVLWKAGVDIVGETSSLYHMIYYDSISWRETYKIMAQRKTYYIMAWVCTNNLPQKVRKRILLINIIF